MRPHFSHSAHTLRLFCLILSCSLVALFSTLLLEPIVTIASTDSPAKSVKAKTPNEKIDEDNPSTLYARDLQPLESSDDQQDSMTAHTSPFIAFTSNRDGNAQLYLMNADGSGQTRLTNNESNDEFPRWSPNNTRILFQSDRDNPFSGSAEVYVMNADGTAQTRLTNNAGDDSCAVWSPSGNQIAFQSARNTTSYQIYLMNADGTNQVNVSNSSANDGEPSWSPDGTMIAFTSDRDHPGTPAIYLMRPDGTSQTRLTFNSSGVKDEQPVWSPDGTKIAFVSTRDSVTESWQETDEDGNVVQRSAVRTNKEIYVMNADGTNQLRLTNNLENDDSPSWSSDGTKIGFRSERERDYYDPGQQVWVMSADGTNQVNLSNNWVGDYCPNWQQRNADISGYNATTGSIVIDFDKLPTGAPLPAFTRLTNQYQQSASAIFSSDNFFGSPQTNNNCGFCVYQTPPNTLHVGLGPWDYREVNIQFTQPVKNLSFYLCGVDTFSGVYGQVDVWENGSLLQTVHINNSGYNTYYPLFYNFSAVSTKITRIRFHSMVDSNGVGIDNLSYTLNPDTSPTPTPTPTPTSTPETRVDVAYQNNGGAITGTTQKVLDDDEIALQAVVTPGAEFTDSYSWSISGPYELISGPLTSTAIKFRYTQAGNYTVTLTHSRHNTNRTASVNFNVLPKVASASFEPVVAGNFLSINPNSGGGLRIYPERFSATDTAQEAFDRRRLLVKAVTSAGPNKTVYFKTFDVDDPSANSGPVDPLDPIAADIGNDNRGTPKAGTFNNCDPLGARVCSSLTDSNGVAVVEFITTMHPGDNFVIAASGDLAYLNELTLAADGISLKDNSGQAPTIRAKATPMLTVWRRVHIEVDSMAPVADNVVTGTITEVRRTDEIMECGYDPKTGTSDICMKTRTEVCVDQLIERNRFMNGRIISNDNSYKVEYNYGGCLTLGYDNYNVQAGAPFTLYDDDDYNSNDGTLLRGDNGEDVEALANQTFSLVRTSDLPGENVFAAAYIIPEYEEFRGRGFNNKVPFVLNVPGTISDITNQFNLRRDSRDLEGDDFWVVYVQIAYQGDLAEDIDGDYTPDGYPIGTGGITVDAAKDVVSGELDVPRGGDGSLVFLEVSRDMEKTIGLIANIKVTPHEIGHQFGLLGDRPSWWIMSPANEPLAFKPEHINLLRWRVKSPGQQ